jgi:Fur family zinc uptake transcriptional regulator
MTSCKSHKKCISKTLDEVAEFCKKNSLKLTPLRKKILEIVLKDHKAVKAYDILDELRKDGFSDKPPIVYRVLDFFIEHKIIHKINSLNAFISCEHLDTHKNCSFLICEKCNDVSECCNKKIEKAIKVTNEDNNFILTKANVEIVGICKNCAA